MRVVCYTRATSCLKGDVSAADSISVQNAHIKVYAEKHGWKVAGKYSDRKKNYEENTAFQALLQDGMIRKFDLVIVDSVYRAGKDLWNAKEVLLQTFHYAGIGFAVVEDDYCSLGRSNEEADLYFDEKYGKLRGETIRYHVNERNKNGILSWSDAKYGYKFSEDRRLVADKATAPIVKRIYEMAASGINPQRIAEILSEEKVPSPLSKRGTNVNIQDPFKWTRLSVRRLLDKTVYIGHWIKHVQGKEITMTNEPIVSLNVFEKAQEFLKKNSRTERMSAQKYMYAGIVCDRKNGFCLRCRTGKSGEKFLVYAKPPKGELHGGKLSLETLNNAVYAALRAEQKKARRILSCIKTDEDRQKKYALSALRDSCEVHAFTIAKLERERMEKYKLYTGRQISEEEMERCEKAYQSAVKDRESIFASFEEKRKRINKVFGEMNPWLKLFLLWDGKMPGTNREFRKYIARIEIEEFRTIRVIPNYEDWYMDFPLKWRNNNGEEEQEKYQ